MLLNQGICTIKKRATCTLVMPSRSSPWFDPAALGNHPSAILDVKHPVEDIHSVTLMRNCLHKNILHARVVMERKPNLLVLTEYYTGLLLSYLTSGEPFISDHGEQPYMIPSSELRNIAIQMIGGLNALWLYDKYHGNFCLENTCYHKTSDGKIVVKLAGFECKGQVKSLSHYQASDVRSLGTVLNRISEIAKELNKQGLFKLDCYQLDHLVKRVNEVAMGDMNYAINDIKREPFFWTSADRKQFLVSIVPLAMQHEFVRDRVDKDKVDGDKVDGTEMLCTLPWDKCDYEGFLPLMVKYRKLKKRDPYDYMSKVSYVYFISGIYAHEAELKNPSAEVDSAVISANPHFFQRLYSLLPRDPRQTDH